MNSGTARKRNSRWDEAPVRNGNGEPRRATTTSRDVRGILAPLSRYRFLPADYVHGFAGGSLDYMIHRLELLSRRPNLDVRRPLQQRANAYANCRWLIYELADRGRHILEEHGIDCPRHRSASNFPRELLISLVMASFEFGAMQADARIIRWSEWFDSRHVPEATRRSPAPFHIPVKAAVGGTVVDARIAADGHPFGIERSIDGRHE